MVNEDGLILEVQSPFSQLILSGKKNIETRAYPLPLELIGIKILLCESQAGENGISCIGDEVDKAKEGIKIVGEICISHCKEYKSQDEWDSERENHRVPEGSSYGWSPTEEGRRYGWIIDKVVTYENPLPVPAMRRR
jgi:predicted transcriptional regulator